MRPAAAAESNGIFAQIKKISLMAEQLNNTALP
jgi:hypothetical protein